MSIVYTWQFPQLDVVYDEGGMQNVVKTINWILIAKDGDYAASCYGTAGVGAPNPQSFIHYQQLTEAEVQAWTEESLGAEQVESYKTNLSYQIEQQKSPTNGNLPPPWTA